MEWKKLKPEIGARTVLPRNFKPEKLSLIYHQKIGFHYDVYNKTQSVIFASSPNKFKCGLSYDYKGNVVV